LRTAFGCVSSRQRKDAGIVTRFAYDARHRVIAIDHPVGGDESYAYSGEGELRVHTDRAGQRIEIDRDGQPTTLSQYGDADGTHHAWIESAETTAVKRMFWKRGAGS
jgi:YD repeat-containing protein